MQDFFFWSAIGFILGVIFASFFEWTLHKYFMHRAVGKFDYAFKAHAVVHHQTFKADHTYHLIDEKDKKTIPMAWWNGPLLVALCQLPFAMIGAFTGNYWILVGSFISCASYYGAYEYMHWCMHLPKKRNIERSGIYFRLNGHHLLHHRYMHKNFNVVLPLADLCLGTLMLRSPVSFSQPTGPAVPNVQPKGQKVEVRELAAVE
jgi:hypothetical protein